MHDIEEKLLQVMEKAEKLQKTFEDVLYSSGSENGALVILVWIFLNG